LMDHLQETLLGMDQKTIPDKFQLKNKLLWHPSFSLCPYTNIVQSRWLDQRGLLPHTASPLAGLLEQSHIL
jgi:hypothetical protein